MELTIIIEEGENGYYVGQIQEYPAAISQGKTISELEENLFDALKLLSENEHNTYIFKRMYIKKTKA